METKNKILILLASICVAFVIGLLVCVAIGLGVWFILNPTVEKQFTINIASTLSPGQAFSNGFIELQLSIPSDISVERNVLVYLDGVEKFSFNIFPNYLQIPTRGLVDGNHIVSVEFLSTSGSRGTGEITVLVEDPMISLVSIDYPLVIYPGLDILISIEISGNASHFVANYSSIFGQSMIINSPIQNGSILTGSVLIPSNLVAVERYYTIPLVVYSIDQRSLLVPRIEVFFQLGATNPFSIDEGIIDLRSFPLTEATNSTNSTLNVTLPPNFELSITTGQSVQVPLEIEQGSTASELLVGFEGLGQHFIIPISSLQNGTSGRRRSTRQSGTETISITVELPPGAIESADEIAMLLRLRNTQGQLGPIQRATILTSSTETGTLHVRLSWDQEADMDLHVVDPNNEEIYYGARSSSGQDGLIDLDSNAGCNIDRIKKENIYYHLAISGEYTIRVDLYLACSVVESINYEVFVEGCDLMETVTGSFLPSEADQGGEGSGREVLVFNVSCNAHLARGTVSYKTPMSRLNPLGSVVRVVDGAGNVLGTSQVERDTTDARRGVYSLSYQPIDVDSNVYVEFLSTNYKIEVTDHTETNIHVYRVTDGIIPSAEAIVTRDVVISTDDGSGAFHIMATMTRGLPLYLSYGGEVADYPRIVNWENGEYAKGTNYPTSYFNGRTIAIGGHATNPDEFDDTVLLHEFGHLINGRTGAVFRGSGPHSGAPIPPSFAFSEGYATYLGQKVIGNYMYCDGVCSDILRLPARWLGTTANGASSGDISEFLVAKVALQLDFELGLGAMMCQALTAPDKLMLEANYNRLGTLTAVDFSDMVSIVVCPLDAAQRDPADDFLNESNLPWIAETEFCI